jgi:hypothetical protein
MSIPPPDTEPDLDLSDLYPDADDDFDLDLKEEGPQVQPEVNPDEGQQYMGSRGPMLAPTPRNPDIIPPENVGIMAYRKKDPYGPEKELTKVMDESYYRAIPTTIPLRGQAGQLTALEMRLPSAVTDRYLPRKKRTIGV